MNESRLNPPHEKEVAFCDGCCLEIYSDDDMLEFADGTIVHNSFDCIQAVVGAKRKTGEQYRREREIDEKEWLSA